jgi:hypothetical protein
LVTRCWSAPRDLLHIPEHLRDRAAVRHPDPVLCPNCAVGEWDMWRNGQYTERGIKEIDGFVFERWRIEPE